MAVLAILLGTALTVGGRTAPAHADNEAVKIMPLGDSITHGTGSSTGSGYRADLWNLLTKAGHRIDYVGSQHSGKLSDPDNEGHPGWRIDQLQNSVAGWLDRYRPQVVLLHIGTNDMNQNHQVATAPDRLGRLIDTITAKVPTATVLVASLVPSQDPTVQARIDHFNAKVPGVVAARSKAGRHVRYVNMASALTRTDLADRLHPNDRGYAKMARAWETAMTVVLPPQPPSPSQSAPASHLPSAGPSRSPSHAPGSSHQPSGSGSPSQSAPAQPSASASGAGGGLSDILGLPVTGTSVSLIVAAGVAAALSGLVGMMLFRRRRQN